MIKTSARVIAIQNGMAQIEADNPSPCGACATRSRCGVSGLGKYFSNHRKAIEIRCDASVQAGDELQLSMTEGDLLKAGLLAYLLPSVLALVGAGIGTTWGDVGAVIGMIAGFLAGFLAAKYSRWIPQLVAKKA